MQSDDPHDAGRDKNGRFAKGTSGNPRGRPKTVRQYDEAELFVFANTLVDVSANGSKKLMTRQLANRHKLFAGSMKGDTRASIYLDRAFAAEEKARAQVRFRYDELLAKYYLGDHQGPIPIADELFMERARTYLHLPDLEPPTPEDWARMRESVKAEMPTEARTSEAGPVVIQRPQTAQGMDQ